MMKKQTLNKAALLHSISLAEHRCSQNDDASPFDMSGGVRAQLSEDLLIGAKAISQFVYGDEKYARRVFYLVEKKRFPAFRMGGSVLYARKSAVMNFIEEQEQQNVASALIGMNDR